MKKEIVFIDEETLTKEELHNIEAKEQSDARMTKVYNTWRAMHGETEE